LLLAIHNRNDVNRIENSITNNIDYQHDSLSINFDLIKSFLIENLSDKWKNLARELDVNENEIERISRENISLKEKFSLVSFHSILFFQIKKNLYS
jgi:hypothetical protein